MDTQILKKRLTDNQKQNHGSIKESEQVQKSPSSPLYSPSSSPSHEFSFSISFDPSSNNNNTPIPLAADNSKPLTLSSSAMDLSPADDIFFHGHLLPLQPLSHLAVPHRFSTDNFNLPIQDFPKQHNTSNSNGNDVLIGEPRIEIKPKAKSFSLFGRSRWRKESENSEKERQKKKPRFDVSDMLKRYIKMVKPLLSMKSRRDNGEFRKQSHSFSGNVSLRHDDNDNGFEPKRREFSAPASMWTSPSNSGILMAKEKNLSKPPLASSDSTMEELQAAIQAAITHCKNSIATDQKIKCH